MMAVVHIAMSIAVRGERAHRWVAASFVGFTLLNLGIAGSSGAAADSLGDSSPWLLLTSPTTFFLPGVLTLTVWSIFDWPLNTARKVLLGAIVVLALPVAVQLFWFALTDDPRGATWEEARYAVTATATPYHVSMILLGGLWAVEAYRSIESNRGLAWSALLAAVPALALSVREVFMARGLVDGPTMVGWTGIPLIGFASASMVVRYVRAVRSAVVVTDKSELEPAYRKMIRLGKGGMGEAWLALRSGEAGFRRWVVIKQVRVDRADDILLERFMVEARVAARLHHANIVSVYDLQETEGGWAIVMEYLAGPSLWDVLTRNFEVETFAPLGAVLSIAEQICRGLECAHIHGVLHRDISPDNVVVTFDGQAKLLDFGIAKETGAGGRDIPTYTGTDATTLGSGVVGKRQYMAPERAIGEPAEPESDIFSVGLVLVQLLGAPLPPRGASLAGHPRPVSDHRSDIPEALEELIVRALSPHPKQRFRSAASFANELQSLLHEVEPVDVGAWVRRLCPERWRLAEQLQNLDDPSREAVNDLFGESYEQTDAPADDAQPTREAGVGPTQGPIRTTIET